MRIKPLKPIIGVAAALMVAGAVAVGVPALTARSADHLDAPLVADDGRLDINDLYAFQSPETPANVVFIMTVNPVAGVFSPTTLRNGAIYEFLIDTGSDAVPDIAYRLTTSGFPTQTVELRKAEGKEARQGDGGSLIATGDVGATLPVTGGGTLQVGVFDDPFFFDLVAFQNVLADTGTLPRSPGGPIDGVDFFAGLNVTAIVLEIPRDTFPTKDIGIWARTVANGKQVDRIGRPTINTVLIPSAKKDKFNASAPAHDRRSFSSEVVDSLLFLSGLDGTPYTKRQAKDIADVLLPDVLTVDTASTLGFLNGRKLDDDVIDAVLPIATGDATALALGSVSAVLTTDEVPANDNAFPGTFPYLAAANP